MSNILLIDDSKLARNLLRIILENRGYTICGEASNGRKGVDKFKKLKPDLVFCDIMMNEMNGVECLRAILAEDPGAKVVICTSAGDKLHANEAAEAGAKDFLVKPINAADVIRVTERLIGSPAPAQKVSYKERMTQRATEKGLDGKPLLDFFEAFQKLNGFGLDDAMVDEQYMRDNMAGWVIGVRALLAAKMPSDQAEKIVDIFKGLV